MRTGHANEKFDRELGRRVFDEDGAREDFARARIENGVVRWNSNDNVPFDDMLFDFVTIGVIDEATRQRSNEARSADTAAFCAEYRKAMANHVPSDEEMFEMRAAFGEGETVVNVITGQRIRL